MPELFPTFDVPGIETLSPEVENLQKHSAYFDFTKGDFVQNKSGILQRATPYDAWVQWCLKAVVTERYAFYAYGTNEGVEMIDALNEPVRAAQESSIERTVTEALLADPYKRTLYVRDFVFVWGVDSLDVTCTIGGVWEREASINFKVNTRG